MVMTLNNISSDGARDYYASAGGEYYEKDSKTSSWQGKIAEDLGLNGKEVNIDIFEKISHGFGLQNEKLVMSAGGKNHRGGIDLTFAAPKSVSLLSLVDDKFKNSHREAVNETLEYVEEKYLQTRKMQEGHIECEETNKGIIAKFEHHTNRNSEVHLHTHSVLMNVTEDSDGKYKTTHNDQIYVDQKKIGMIYRYNLANSLTKEGINIEVTDRKEGFFEIKGVARHIVQKFSTRRKEVVEMAKEITGTLKNASYGKLMDIAAIKSRSKKGKVLDRNELIERTNKVLDADNKSIQSFHEEVKNQKNIELGSDNIVFFLQEAIKGIEENKSAWTKAEMLDHAAKLSIGRLSFKELEKKSDQLLENEKLKELGTKYTRKGSLKYFSSEKMKKIETFIINHSIEGKGQSKVFIPEKKYNKFLKDNPKIGETFKKGQMEALDLIAKSEDRFIGIQGDAGTGKTYAMSYVREVFEENGFSVKGMAHTGKAANELQKDAQIKNCQTIDSFLLEKKKTFNNKKELWLIDESGQVGSKKVATLMKKATKINAKVVFIGDVKQFSSIEQGRVFRDIQKKSAMKFVEMREVLRQKEDSLRSLVKNLNDYMKSGKDSQYIKNAFDTLKSTKSIVESETFEKRVNSVKNEYLKDIKSDKTVLIVTGRNDERKVLNESIRNELISKGEVKKGETFKILESVGLSGKEKIYVNNYKIGLKIFFQNKVNDIKKGQWGEITELDNNHNNITVKVNNRKKIVNLFGHSNSFQAFKEESRNFSENDKIIFTKNDKKIGVKNGELGVIKEIDKNGNALVTIDDRNLKLSLRSDKNSSLEYRYIDHAHAITIYKSQGGTVDKIICSIPSDAANYNSMYVAKTRAKHEIKIFTDNIESLEKNTEREENNVSTLEFSGKKTHRKMDDIIKRIELFEKDYIPIKEQGKEVQLHR